MSEAQNITAKAGFSTLIVFSLMTLPFFFGFLSLHVSLGRDMAPAWLSGGLWLLVCLWWQRFYVCIDQHTLTYRTLFGGRRQIRLDDIGKVVDTVDFRSRGFRPPIRLEVFDKQAKRPVFDINQKVFSLKDVRRINAALKPYMRKRH